MGENQNPGLRNYFSREQLEEMAARPILIGEADQTKLLWAVVASNLLIFGELRGVWKDETEN